MLVLLLAVVGVLAIVLILLGEPYTWMLLGFASIVLSQVVLFMCYFSYKFKSFYGGSRISVRLSTLTFKQIPTRLRTRGLPSDSIHSEAKLSFSISTRNRPNLRGRR
jgi:hypothetical protein